MPKYDVSVDLVGKDGNAFVLIAAVAAELRRSVDTKTADDFVEQATDCGSYDELLAFIQDTVHVK